MEETLTLKVTELVKETPDAITIRLLPLNVERVTYKAGQFLTLLIQLRGKQFRRSYSLSSAPDHEKELSITVKRIINGEVSSYIFDHLKKGDILHSLIPAGRFTLPTDQQEQRDIFLVAAGSGITPVFSILKSVLVNEPLSRVTLIYSSKNPANTIFFRQLNHLEKQYPSQLKCIYIFSEPDEYRNRQYLNIGLLQHLIDSNIRFAREKAEFFLCGPFPFMRMADITIVVMGFEEDKIHKENFVVLSEQRALDTPPFIKDTSDKLVRIRYKSDLYELIVPYGKTILKAALDKGIYLPYSCNAGICGTCTAVCREGKVKMPVNEVLTAKDLHKGYILTCTGYPESSSIIVDFSEMLNKIDVRDLCPTFFSKNLLY